MVLEFAEFQWCCLFYHEESTKWCHILWMKRVAFLRDLQMAAESVPACALLVSGREITSTVCTPLRLPMAKCLRLNNKRKRQLTSLVFVHHCHIWYVRKLSRTPHWIWGIFMGQLIQDCVKEVHVSMPHMSSFHREIIVHMSRKDLLRIY